jgi:hypothetical protein
MLTRSNREFPNGRDPRIACWQYGMSEKLNVSHHGIIHSASFTKEFYKSLKKSNGVATTIREYFPKIDLRVICRLPKYPHVIGL